MGSAPVTERLFTTRQDPLALAGANGETIVRLDAEVELDGIASVLAPVARRMVMAGWTPTSQR